MTTEKTKTTLRTELIGTDPRGTWAAEITGLHPRYKFTRDFLSGAKDRSEQNSAGTRGIYVSYSLESGKIYEIQEAVSWTRSDRYFARLDNDGKIVRMTADDVRKALA